MHAGVEEISRLQERRLPIRQSPLEWALHWEESLPDRLWLTQPSGGGQTQTWTYRQAMDEVRRMAAHLRDLELPSRSHIALCSKNCAHWMIADLAIMMAGHVSVPLYPTLTEETVRAILEHSESKLLFVGKLDVWDEMKSGVPADMPMIALPLAPDDNVEDFAQWADIIADKEPMAEAVSSASDDLATIVYTSGSTGMPKGVMLSFGAITGSGEAIAKQLAMNESDRMLSYLPLSHVMERFLVECAGLAAGLQVFFAETLTTFLKDLRRARPTCFVSVPRLWLKFQLGVFAKMPAKKLALLLRIPIVRGIVAKKVLTQLGLEEVRIAGSGSAPIPAALIEWYGSLGLELLEAYGMSENFSFSHLTRPGEVKPGYVGRPYDEVQCRISDEGEIQIKSPGNMMGYYKEPELTKAVYTEDGWLRTGDLGEEDSRGRLKITGRIKELFKTSKGKYVAPAPIENIVLNHPRIELACVGGAGFPQPHALVMLSEETRGELDNADNGLVKDQLENELKDLLALVNRQVDHHEQLQFIAVSKDEWQIENGFLTPTMKIRRNKIEAAFDGYNEEWYAAKLPVIWQ